MGKSKNWLIIVLTSTLFLYLISMLLPILWTFLTSLKSRSDFVENVFGLPLEWKFDNYLTVVDYFYVDVPDGGAIKRVFIEEMLLNSIVYAVGCAFVNVMVTLMAGYTVAKYSSWNISKFLVSFALVAIALPIIGSLPSELQISKALGLHNHIYGMWIMKANFLNVYFMVFISFFKRIPVSYEEAAKLDGASNFCVFRRIHFPMVINTFLTVFIIKFVEFWNDYQTPLLFMPSIPTLSLGLYYYNFSPIGELSSVPLKLAGATTVFLPILLVFVVFSKRLMGSVVIGGLK